MTTVQAVPNSVTVEEAKARLDDLVERVHRGEEWLITDVSGQPVAKLAAAPAVKTAEEVSPENGHEKLFGLMPEIQLLPGWDDPLEEFEEYS